MRFFKKNPDTGLLEIIDGESGEVIATEKRPSASDMVFDKKKFSKHTDGNGKEYFLENGLSPADVGRGVRRWQPAQHIKDNIVRLYGGDGAPSLTKICKMDGFPPYYDVCQWRAQDPEFDKALSQARKDRAELFADKVIETVENLEGANRDETSVAKLQADAYKWAAEKSDPDKFGNKTKISGDPSAPIGFILDTGVPQKKESVDGKSEQVIEGTVKESSENVRPLHPEKTKLVEVTQTELDAE